jgi:hypothetical protein
LKPRRWTNPASGQGTWSFPGHDADNQNLVRLLDWLSALAGLLVAAAAMATLYDETGYTYCFEPEGAGPICRTVAVAHPVAPVAGPEASGSHRVGWNRVGRIRVG